MLSRESLVGWKTSSLLVHIAVGVQAHNTQLHNCLGDMNSGSARHSSIGQKSRGAQGEFKLLIRCFGIIMYNYVDFRVGRAEWG